MYRFNRRTAEPLEPFSAPGCDKPTSRCQTIPSIRTLRNYQPVIPSVPFICWSITFPYRIIGSLWPTFIAVWLIWSYSLVNNMPLRSINDKNHSESTYVHPRYTLEGDRPSQTDKYKHFILWTRPVPHLAWQSELSSINFKEWYFNLYFKKHLRPLCLNYHLIYTLNC